MASLTATVAFLIAAAVAAPQISPASSSSTAIASQSSGVASVATSQFVPKVAQCPSHPIVRPAKGLSKAESAWAAARKSVAARALQDWLRRTDQDFDVSCDLPTLAMSTSGGGFRSMLTGSGVHQAMDLREQGDSPVAGLWQALTWEAAISGGNWMLGGQAQNNWPTISALLEQLWRNSTHNGILAPEGQNATGPIWQELRSERSAKQASGFPVSFVDLYGRLLGYMLLESPNGGVGSRISDIRSFPNFTTHNVPYPILVATGLDQYGDACPNTSNLNNSQVELAPFEFGSWDAGITAFADSKYMGSTPSNNKTCVTGFDNTGLLMGAASDAPAGSCKKIGLEVQTNYQKLFNFTNGEISQYTNETLEFLIPNPWYGSDGSPLMKDKKNLQLSDGGAADMGTAIWPMLFRPIDVLFVNDNSAEQIVNGVLINEPNGTTVHNTYIKAQREGLSRMPAVPEPSTFVKEGYNTRNVAFGCDQPEAMTIIYLPNSNYTYDSNKATTDKGQTLSEIDGLVSNGNAIARYNGTAGWGTCVGCLVMKKTGTALPAACDDCFKQYCIT